MLIRRIEVELEIKNQQVRFFFYLFKTLSSSGLTSTENSSIAALTAFSFPEFKLIKHFSRSDNF